jgi:hypothetical protein
VPKDGRTHLHLSPRPPFKKDNKEKENPVCVCECVVTQRHRKSHMLKGKRRESLSPCPFGERTRRRWATRGRTGQGYIGSRFVTRSCCSCWTNRYVAQVPKYVGGGELLLVLLLLRILCTSMRRDGGK